MLILIDIGNTNIVFGIVENNKIVNTYRLATDLHASKQDYYEKINNYLIFKNINQDNLQGVAISSVVPLLDQNFIEIFEEYYNIKPLMVSAYLKSEVEVKDCNKDELGADLYCDAVGAYHKYHDPVIIVDLGTATKFIIINEQGELKGIVIAPGIQGSLNGLISSTSKLPKVTLNAPDTVLGTQTIECIQIGVIHGHAAMIEGMIARIKKELKESCTKVIITGGYSPLIKNLLTIAYYKEPNILLEGLLEIYLQNK